METILALFAGYVLDAKLIKQILRWEMEIVKESPLIRELYQLGFEEGRQTGLKEGHQEGREEGERKATLEALHQILTIRFKRTSGEFQERLNQLDLPALKQLNEAALTVQSLAAFEEALAETLSRSQAEPNRSESDGSPEKEA